MGAAPAAAEDYTNNSLRLGLYAVFYHSSADDISGPFVPAGVNVDAKDVQTLYLGYVATVVPHFDIELALGYPPLTKTVGKGTRHAGFGALRRPGHLDGTVACAHPAVRIQVLP